MEAVEGIVNFILGVIATFVVLCLLLFVAAGAIDLVKWFRRID